MTDYPHTVGLELQDVDIERGGEMIVSNIHLKVAPGEIIQLFGPNGSGKTSLLQTISGLTPRSGGQILWSVNGEDKGRTRPASLMSFIGHNVPLKFALSGVENLQYWARLYGSQIDDVYRVLDYVNLSHAQNMPTARYSAGQKRRLDLARCLLANRPMWLLDEPTASLDTDSRALWEQEIQTHQDKGGCAIIGTHDRFDLNSRDIRLG